MVDITASIIIPAHNEALVIEKTLTDLLQEARHNLYEIIVVCNACTDNTANLVSHFNDVKLLETNTASKTHALNLGDAIATGDIRIYMDADVRMTANDIEKIIMILKNDEFLAVSPNVQMDHSGSSWFVRAYYNIWFQLPYVKEGFMGGGVYALSAKGRKRFNIFPDVISDDGYIRELFSINETQRIEDIFSIVRSPKSLSGLIKIKTRSRLGLYELMEKHPNIYGSHKKSYRNAITKLFKKPTNWPKIIVYLFVNIRCRINAQRIFKSNSKFMWETDTSSRQ